MNDHSSKKINFNRSTLLSLKAELMKKQEEVYEKKQLPQNKIENFKPAKGPDTDKIINESKTTLKDNLKPVDTEELEACRKAKLALEKKAELYEHLADSAGTSELASLFLVDFGSKKLHDNAKSGPEESPDNDGEAASLENDDNEWTEFTDCLGRTRKCHKSDLEVYVQKDQELMRTMFKDGSGNDSDLANKMNEINKSTEKPLLVQKTNDYLMSLREKWEEKERALLAKDKDIHYQDLLFDEARIHGVGYFAFSTDEAERQKQMEELMKRRQETLQAQQDAEETRKKRDALMAARVAAARARQRARAGLPPEEPKIEKEKDFATCLFEFLTQQRNEADAKALEEEKKLKEEQEKERQKLREAYVREWDIGKDGVDDKVKKFREMSQEEYVEQQRDKRIDEFAPPQSSTTTKSNYSFDDKGRMLELDSSVPVKKTWSDVRPRVSTPPPPDIGDISDQKGLYFSTAKASQASMKYRNFVKAQESTPIINELDGNEDVKESEYGNERECVQNHAEVAPPPTYDYYGPAAKYSRPNKPFESDIRESYAQGAKSLETKSNYKQLSKQYDFTFD